MYTFADVDHTKFTALKQEHVLVTVAIPKMIFLYGLGRGVNKAKEPKIVPFIKS